jgi:hypothetical protein
MSNIMVYDIVGTGDFAVPENNGEAVEAGNAISGLLNVDPGVEDLVCGSVEAWVIDSQSGGGTEGSRSLACLISEFTYNGELCPSEADTDTLIAALRAALLHVPGGDIGWIISVGVIELNIFDAGFAPLTP